MKLKSIFISRKGYGENPDQLTGKIEFDNFQSTVAMVLSEEQAAKMLALVAEDSVRYAHELADILLENAQKFLPTSVQKLLS